MTQPLLEKYIPQFYSDIISQKKIINILKSYTDNNDFPNCILYGTAGIGKTSIIKAAINELYFKQFKFSFYVKNKQIPNVLWLNASEERGVKNFELIIDKFIKNKSFNNKFKILIFDECDNLTIKTQLKIKNYINVHSNIKYCFICNDIYKINDSIKSKCLNLKLSNCKEKDIFNKMKQICRNEYILITDEALLKIIRLQNKDIRAIMNNLQYYSLLYHMKLIIAQYIKSNEEIDIYKILYNLDINDKDYYNKVKLLYYMEKYYVINKHNEIIKKMYNIYFKNM